MKKLITFLVPLALASCAAQPAYADELYGPPDTVGKAPALIVPAKLNANPELFLNEAKPLPTLQDIKREKQKKNWNATKPAAILSTALHLADAWTTGKCVRMGRKNPGSCYETNSFYGSELPSDKTIIAIKAPTIIGSWLLGKEISKISPVAANVFFGSQIVFTGKTVINNIKIVY